MIPKFSEYTTLFKVQGKLTCLQGEILTSSSLGLGHSICLYHDEHWDTFMSADGLKRCNAKGAEILGTPEAYAQFAQSFREYIALARRDVIPRWSSLRDITVAEFEEMLSLLKPFWYFYGITDFPYADGMHQAYELNPSIELADAVEDFGKLKFEGRDILNAYMHEDGVLSNFHGSVAQKGGLAPEDGQFLYTEDKRAIMRGKPVDSDIIRKRRDFYGCGFDGAFHIFSYDESKRLWDEFHPPLANEDTLKGIVANKGKAQGRVVIAPMHTNKDAIAKVVALMREGDVLVAESTTPEYVALCKKASAIVTDQGGMLSHAAVVSREFGKPCIVGTKFATQVLKDGDMVEVDAERGTVTILERAK